MALIFIHRCIVLTAIILFREAQSRVIINFNATELSLEGQNRALAMRKFKDDHDINQKALLTDEELQNRLLESDSDGDIVDLILSQGGNPSHPYVKFLNSHGGAAQVFNSSSEASKEDGDDEFDSDKNKLGIEQGYIARGRHGRVNVTREARDAHTEKLEGKRLQDPVRRNGSKLLRKEPNRIHPINTKVNGFKTYPRFRNRTKRQVELYMYNINRNSTDHRKHQRKMRMQTVCSALTAKEEIAPNPLMCYQCESYSSEKEPRCDVVLWNYLRESEKHYIR